MDENIQVAVTRGNLSVPEGSTTVHAKAVRPRGTHRFLRNQSRLGQQPTGYFSAFFVVLMTTAATLYGSAFEAGRRSSRRPFQPASIVPMGMRIEAPRS